MRDFKGMKRQRNRNRNGGGGGGGSGGGGGGKPQHNANRAFDSNGPEGVKVRGAAQHVYEKYQQLARDATTSGDRVLAENYLQHAEHYFRLMRAMQPQRPLSEIIGRDQFVSGFDIDFEDEPSTGDAAEGEGEPEAAAEPQDGERPFRPDRRDDYRRDDYRRDDARQGEYRQTDSRQTDSRQSDNRQGENRSGDTRQADYRQDRYQGERNGGDRSYPERPQADRFGGAERPRDDRGQRNGRDERPRYQRDDRPVREDRPPRFETPASDPLGVVEPEATPLTAAPAAPAPILRADDGEISHAPAFLQPRTREPRAEGTEERRPRRRRSTAAATAPETEAPPPASDEG
jgi:hypothetical protein